MNDKRQIYYIQYQLDGETLRAFQEAFMELQDEVENRTLASSNYREANELIARIKAM
jgi:hypothetical protein